MMPPVAAGIWNSVMAAPAVKFLAGTDPVPKDGAESIPRMVTVAKEELPMVAVDGSTTLFIRKVTVSSGSTVSSLATR